MNTKIKAKTDQIQKQSARQELRIIRDKTRARTRAQDQTSRETGRQEHSHTHTATNTITVRKRMTTNQQRQ